MKKYTFLFVLTLGVLAGNFFGGFGIFGVSIAHAITPTLTLTSSGNSAGQIFVYGDANASVKLFYGPSASLSATVGTTDQSGNLTLPISLNSYAVNCGNRAYVIINNQQSPSIAWSISPAACQSNSNSAISFSQDNVVLNVGQSQTVVIYGSSPYTVTNNSNSSVISTGITGNVLTVSAVSFGGATIRVCDSTNQCDTVDVVAVNNGPQQTNSYTQPFGLASFMVASDNAAGGFIKAGNTLTVTFSGNRPLTGVTARVNGSPQSITGGGSGPYSLSYRVTGAEAALFPVVLSFTDTSGTPGQVTFALGNLSSSAQIPVTTPPPTTPPAPVTPTPAPTPVTPAAPTYTFTQFLNLDDTGPEVTQLQKRLTVLGFYSGPITGTFGPLTQAAVKKLQKAHGITQAGYVGPGTRAVLNK